MDKVPETQTVDMEKVNSGVRFLSHPDVQTTPLADRLAFLEKKGLSRNEINAAIEQHHKTVSESTRKEDKNETSWISSIAPIVGGSAVLGLLWKFMQYDPQISVDNRHVEELQEREQIETPLVQALHAQTREISKLVSLLQQDSKDRRDSAAKEANHAAEVKKLQSELASLKLKLNNDTTTSLGIETESTKLDESASASVESLSTAMLQALELVEKENDPKDIKQAAHILIMYTKNLIDHPDIPRYRRIAVGNANYKQKIEPLKHHDALLSSIGFEKSGMNLEWKWYSEPLYSTRIDIVKAAVKAFESRASTTATTDSTLVETAKKYLSSTTRVKIVPPSETEPEATNLETFLTKLKQKETEEPKYPSSFGDVIKMIQSGEEVPGIKEIEEKTSQDAEKCLNEPPTSQEISKPWIK